MNNIRKRLHPCLCGHNHDSYTEAVRCNQLNEMLQSGKISDLRYQVRYQLIPKFPKRGEMTAEQAVFYIADFVYKEEGTEIVEDLKSTWTAKDGVYKLKKKLFKSLYCREGSEIIFREVVK